MSRPDQETPRAVVIACGALAREIGTLTRDLPGIEVRYLAAKLHNRPERIPDAVRQEIRRARAEGVDRVLVGYADCGTGGLLDRLAAEESVERLPGAHCYEFYAGSAAFAALHDEEPGTFYLTDFLVRAFDGLVWRGLGLDRHPELRDAYFGNYRRLVYLAQTDDAALRERAREAAVRLGLDFEERRTGLGELETSVRAFADHSEPAALAPLARNALPGATEASRGAEDLRLVQEIGPPGGDGAGAVHHAEGIRRRRPSRRRCVHGTQREVRTVHDVQARDLRPGGRG